MEGVDPLYQLATEVDRIVSSPYPVSLKSLHEILLLDQDGEALIWYSSSSPCKIRALATSVADALEYQQFTPDLLSQLCASGVFRDQLLALCPSVLDLLIRKAASGLDQYFSLCVQILRCKLPQTQALPVSAESLFVSVMKDAVRNPSAKSLGAAYALLSGACRHFPQILPRQEWMKLEAGLIEIVKSSRTIQDQSLSLLCLGILRVLAEQQTDSRAEYGSDASTFFTGSKSLKTLSLAVLQAVWITKTSDHSLTTDVLQNLDIVFNIVCALPNEQIGSWTASAEGQAAISRLFTQAQSKCVHNSIRLKLLSIISTIFCGRSLPMKMAPQVLDLVADARFLHVDPATFDSMRNVLAALLVTSPSDTTRTVFRLVHQIGNSETSSTLQIRNLNTMLNSMQTSLAEVLSIAGALRTELLSIDIATIDKGISASNEYITSQGPHVCPATMTRTKQAFRRDFVSLCLVLELSATNVNANALGNARTMRMLQYLQNSAVLADCDCVKPRAWTTKPLALIEAPSYDPQYSGHSWRNSIHNFAIEQSEWQEQNLVRMVANICGDLEERCNNAEKPLHASEKKNEELQHRLLELQKRNSGLEHELQDLATRLRISDEEKVNVQEAFQSENERLIERIQSLDQTLQEEKESAQKQYERLQSDSRAQKLKFRSAMIEKDMLMDELKSERDELRHHESEAATALKIAASKASEQAQAHEELQGVLDTKTDEAKSLQLNVTSLEAQIVDQIRKQQETEAVLTTVRDELQQCREQNQQLEVDHVSENEQWEDRLRDEACLHATTLDGLRREIAAAKSELEGEIDRLQTSFSEEKDLKQELQRCYTEAKALIHDQQMELEQLQTDVAARDQEIAEFQAMRQTLAAALGHLPERKHLRKSVHYAQAINRSPASRRQSRHQTMQRDAFPPEASEVNTRSTKSFPPDAAVSFGSASAEDGSTPKRTKPRKSFKVPIARQPRVSAVITPKSVRSRTQRPPLEDISSTRVNRSPSRRILTSPKKAQIQFEAAHGDLAITPYAGLEELDFGSEVFTSTPFSPMKVAARNEDDEDTTVDE